MEGSRGNDGHYKEEGSNKGGSDAPRRWQQEEVRAPRKWQREETRASGNRQQDDALDPEVGEEEVKVKVARNPGNPTLEEVERHNVTHMPYRAWCPVCVEAKGKEEPHKRLEEKGDKPKVGLDYKSFGQESTGNDQTTMRVGRDRDTRMTFCHACLCKRPTDDLGG